MASLDQLPPELYAAILEQLDGTLEQRQQSILALTRAIPRSPVPDDLLFGYIRFTRPEQAFFLYRRLKRRPEDASRVRIFRYESWTAHADHLVNLLSLLHNVEEMFLWFGPDFAPEHLEDIFTKPRTTLRLLHMRFRPYVQRATYYPFLKGDYFDSTLDGISSWPQSKLSCLSIIQDPLDPSIAPTEGFAQPLVFFCLDHVSTLTTSPAVSTVSNFRFRVRARHIARYLSVHENALPSTELLDISTTMLNEAELEKLLARIPRVKHLIMDGCPVVSQRADALEAEGAEELGQWSSLGATLVAACIYRSKGREAKYKHWLEAQTAHLQDDAAFAGTVRSRAKKGRKGLATATISIRKQPEPQTASAPQLGPSKLFPPSRPPPEKISILPPLPSLRSFAITAPMVSPDRPDFEVNYAKVQQEFERGWSLGFQKLISIRSRMRQTFIRKGSVFRFVDQEKTPLGEENAADIMYGLEPVESADEFAVVPPPAPLLCLVGPGKARHHPEGCPHRLAWDTWQDEL